MILNLLFFLVFLITNNRVVNAKDLQSKCSFETGAYIKKLNNPIFNYINKRNIEKIGDSFNYHWQLKKKLSKKITDPKIDKLYDILINKFNILGGKLIGAGGGGFFLVCARNKKKLIGKLKKNKINYLEFQIEKNGSIIFDTN